MLITEASSRQRMRAGFSEECISALAAQLMVHCEQLRIFWGEIVCEKYEDVRHILLQIEGVECDWCINFPSSIYFDV